jgi:hypothetical protein
MIYDLRFTIYDLRFEIWGLGICGLWICGLWICGLWISDCGFRIADLRLLVVDYPPDPPKLVGTRCARLKTEDCRLKTTLPLLVGTPHAIRAFRHQHDPQQRDGLPTALASAEPRLIELSEGMA